MLKTSTGRDVDIQRNISLRRSRDLNREGLNSNRKK
jgi:hypothetical protein